MSEDPTQPPGSNGSLDFERADFSTAPDGSAGSATGTEQSAGAPPACAVCQVPVASSYYTRGADMLCERCSLATRDAGPPGSAATRMLGAVALGGVAAIVASGLWLLVTELTGYEIGLIAIVVGFLVGAAVRMGGRQLGGLPYQLVAVLLSYSAIVMTYVPAITTELMNNEAFTSQMQAAEAGDPYEVEASEADEAVVAVTAVVVAIPIAYMMPFLMGFENVIGILIIGFALWQAWKMNARMDLALKGPFRLGDAALG